MLRANTVPLLITLFVVSGLLVALFFVSGGELWRVFLEADLEPVLAVLLKYSWRSPLDIGKEAESAPPLTKSDVQENAPSLQVATAQWRANMEKHGHGKATSYEFVEAIDRSCRHLVHLANSACTPVGSHGDLSRLKAIYTSRASLPVQVQFGSAQLNRDITAAAAAEAARGGGVEEEKEAELEKDDDSSSSDEEDGEDELVPAILTTSLNTSLGAVGAAGGLLLKASAQTVATASATANVAMHEVANVGNTVVDTVGLTEVVSAGTNVVGVLGHAVVDTVDAVGHGVVDTVLQVTDELAGDVEGDESVRGDSELGGRVGNGGGGGDHAEGTASGNFGSTKNAATVRATNGPIASVTSAAVGHKPRSHCCGKPTRKPVVITVTDPRRGSVRGLGTFCFSDASGRGIDGGAFEADGRGWEFTEHELVPYHFGALPSELMTDEVGDV